MSACALTTVRDDHTGPYNVTIVEGGEGLTRPLTADTASLDANGSWSMTGWVNPKRSQAGTSVLFGVGGSPEDSRVLMLSGGEFTLFVAGRAIQSGAAVPPGEWTAVAATFDGKRARLFVNGKEAGGDDVSIGATAGRIHVAPVVDMPDVVHFGGQLAEFKLHKPALDAKQVQALFSARPKFDVMVFHEVGGNWPSQSKQWRGETQQPQYQPPGTQGPKVESVEIKLPRK
jgi:hypothetical protein